MNKNDVTYKELIDFYKDIEIKLNAEQKVNFYIAYKEQQEEEIIKQQVLNLFPKFENQSLEIFFINPEKTMAIITVYRKDEIVGYFSYLNYMGLVNCSYNSFDAAVIGCISQKYMDNTPNHPSMYAIKMLGVNNTLNYGPIEKEYIEKALEEELNNKESEDKRG